MYIDKKMQVEWKEHAIKSMMHMYVGSNLHIEWLWGLQTYPSLVFCLAEEIVKVNMAT